MTKNNKFRWSNIKYFLHLSTILILSQKWKFWYSETYSLAQKNRLSGSTLSMQNAKLRCCVQTTDRKGLSFSDILDQCSLMLLQQSLTCQTIWYGAFWKQRCKKFWSWNVSPFAAKYCLVMWEESLWYLQTIKKNRIPSLYPKCSLVSKGKNLSLLKPIQNCQSHTAMPLWFSMVDYLQTLTVSKINILVFGSVLIGTVLMFLWCH